MTIEAAKAAGLIKRASLDKVIVDTTVMPKAIAGSLADPSAAENEGTTPVASRRFDQRLEKLRLTSPPGRPLIYFTGPIP